MESPKWAQDVIINAMIYLEIDKELPTVKWRKSSYHQRSSGTCYANRIVITAGKKRTDQKLVLLHELAHYCSPWGEHHSDAFWDLAWRLYRWAKLPILYCKGREDEYRVGALASYRRNRKSEVAK